MAVDNRNFVNKFANEGGGDVLVEDKRMEELKSATAKTSSQISTSANYIPLQDTDGNLVKINPASFEEAVRNVLGGLLANNDKGTTISGVPALSGSGNSLDFGSITPANLASVLGVQPIYTFITNNDNWETDIVQWTKTLPSNSLIDGRIHAGWVSRIIGYNLDGINASFLIIGYTENYSVRIYDGNIVVKSF